MRARTERRKSERALAKAAPTTKPIATKSLPARGRLRWPLLAMVAALLLVVVGATATSRVAPKPAAIVMPALVAATAPPASPSPPNASPAAPPPASEPSPLDRLGLIHWEPGQDADEFNVDFDLSEGRGEHVQSLLLPRRLPVTLLGTGDDEPTTKPVGELKAGDRVLLQKHAVGLVTSNQKGPVETDPSVSRVVGTSNRLTDTMLDVQTTTDVVQTTPEHPFMVLGKGWTEAGKLQAGDRIETSTDATITVRSTVLRKLATPQRVYNLETSPHHTFYVGKEHLLVHNGGCISLPGSLASALEGASEAAFKAASNADAFKAGSKHLAGAGGKWAKFAEGVSPNAALRDALSSPGARFLPNDASSFKVIADLGRTIGTKGETGLRAVVDFGGHVVTFFPVKP